MGYSVKTEDELFDAPDAPSVNEVTELPQGFRAWLKLNQARLERASERGTAPYWIRDNKQWTRQTSTKATAIYPRLEDIESLFYRYRDFRNATGGVLYVARYFTPKDTLKPDFYNIRSIGEDFARRGHIVLMSPSLHRKDERYKIAFAELLGTRYEGKCPDLIIDGHPYEYEGYQKPWKKDKVKRMISHGLKQASRLVIDNSKGCSHRYILKLAHNRLRDKKVSDPIDEIWILEKGRVILIYKKAEGGT